MTVLNKEMKENRRVELTIRVERQEWQQALDDAYQANRDLYPVDGCAPGKATRQALEQAYAPDVFYQEAVNATFPRALVEAFGREEILVAGAPELRIVDIGPEGFTFAALAELYPEVKLGQYKGLSAPMPQAELSNDDVDKAMEEWLQAHLVEQERDRAAMGDEVTLDFDGSVDGVPFEGGKAENYPLLLGSGMFIPGFEEQLVGANIGDDVTVTVTFPTEYHAPELAGKPAEFRCRVHEIRTHGTYEMDDNFAKEIGQCDTMEQMRENMGKALQDYYNERAEQELRWQLMHQVAATVEEQPSDEELDRMVEAQMETLTAQLAQKGLTLEAYCQFTGSDEKKLREDMRPDALEAFRTQKAVEKIAQLENLTVTDEEMNAAIERICADNHMSAEDLKPYFDNGFLTVVRQQMLRDKATEVVRRSAQITQ